ncbi:agmatine deiminase family protein [Aquimarina rhabdastrellae]
MNKLMYNMILLILTCYCIACSKSADDVENVSQTDSTIRVPAEWETQEATWVQWGFDYEDEELKAFANFINIIKQYQPVHIVFNTIIEEDYKEEQIAKLAARNIKEDDPNIIFHHWPINFSWMRDNGPIYVTDGEKTWAQNWTFNAWGGGFGDFLSEDDNRIPVRIADYLGIEVENRLDYVLERGNLESNGDGILMLNWDCQLHRNPTLRTKEAHETILKETMGATKVIWAEGYYEDDGTIGHIDGMARFISKNEVVVTIETTLEDTIARVCTEAGFTVHRYPGSVNWLIGNGFVVTIAKENERERLRPLLKSYFPNRTIYFIEGESIEQHGGGIHCVTNDQPRF